MSWTVAGVLGSIGSAVGQAASSLGGGILNYYANRSLTKKQIEQQAAAQVASAKELALNAPSWNVQGLRDAGINPILAANNGNLSDVNSVGVSGSSASPFGDLGNPVMQYYTAKNMKEQNELLHSQTEGQEAHNLKSLVDTYNDILTTGLSGIPGGASAAINGFQHEELLNAIKSKISSKLGIPSNTVNSAKSSVNADNAVKVNKRDDDDDGSVTVGSGTDKRTFYYKRGSDTPYKVLDYQGKEDKNYMHRLRGGR